MSRIYSLLLSALLLFAIGGCGGNSDGPTDTTGETQPEPHCDPVTHHLECIDGAVYEYGIWGDGISDCDDGLKKLFDCPFGCDLHGDTEENPCCEEYACFCTMEDLCIPEPNNTTNDVISSDSTTADTTTTDAPDTLAACDLPTWLEKAVAGCKDLEGAELVGAYLWHADLEGANLTNADLTDANLVAAELQEANLTNANLTNADLSEADMYGANLTDANLTNTKVVYTNLTEANLQNANLTGIQWGFTPCPDGTNSEDHGDTCCGHLNEAIPSAGCD